MRRALVVAHRWPALLVGLLLVVETTTGAALLYRQELFRATHAGFYRHTTAPSPVTAPAAVAAVERAHPHFAATWISYDHGIIAVGDASYNVVYAVDPGSGRINGSARLDGGFMGLLANIHECALSCAGYPGYLPWTGEPVWAAGPSVLTGITWGGLLLGMLGLLMIGLFATGLRIWWPGLRRLGARMVRVRTNKGRFARDYDLHNVIAAWAMPFILMWGLTGAAFEFPVVENAWLAITGGHRPAADPYTFASDAARRGAPVDFATASAIARTKVPGTIAYVELPTTSTPYYVVDIRTTGSYAYRNFYSGDVDVYVDRYDSGHVKTTPPAGDALANRFYDNYLEPTHFGWNVNGWWRLLWLVFGLAPLGLMVTGVSTWLFRRRVRTRRRRTTGSHTVGAPQLTR